MTKRKPLRWQDGDNGHSWPLCVTCMELWSNPRFVEAVSSVAIEHAGVSAFAMGQRALNNYHARRHPAEMRAS